MAMREILDRQANAIEYILRTHGINAQIDGGKMSPRLAHFHVALPPGVRATLLSPLIPEIAGELGITSCRMSHGEEGVYLEIPRPDPVPVRLLPIVQRVADVIPSITATLGLDSEGTPLLLRLNSPDVDPLLVVGNRGAGKSSLLGGMALSLALHNSPDKLRLLLIDCTGEGRAFRGLENLPHLACPVANSPVDAMLSLRWALRMLSRNASAHDPFALDGDEEEEELTFGDEDSSSMPVPAASQDGASLIVMIDGADLLCRNGHRRAEAEVVTALNKLLAGGSRHNIHLALSVERLACVDDLEVDWAARIVGQVASPEAARQATGMKGTGAQGLMGAGDFLISLNTDLIRFQSPAISSGEIARAVALITSCAQAQTEAQQPPSEEYAEYVPRDTSAALPSRKQERQEHYEHYEEPIQLRRNWIGD